MLIHQQSNVICTFDWITFCKPFTKKDSCKNTLMLIFIDLIFTDKGTINKGIMGRCFFSFHCVLNVN